MGTIWLPDLKKEADFNNSVDRIYIMMLCNKVKFR